MEPADVGSKQLLAVDDDVRGGEEQEELNKAGQSSVFVGMKSYDLVARAAPQIMIYNVSESKHRGYQVHLTKMLTTINRSWRLHQAAPVLVPLRRKDKRQYELARTRIDKG